jgi:hypothetical protein
MSTSEKLKLDLERSALKSSNFYKPRSGYFGEVVSPKRTPSRKKLNKKKEKEMVEKLAARKS